MAGILNEVQEIGCHGESTQTLFPRAYSIRIGGLQGRSNTVPKRSPEGQTFLKLLFPDSTPSHILPDLLSLQNIVDLNPLQIITHFEL